MEPLPPPLRVLVVGDDVALTEAARDELRERGHVAVATTGTPEALGALEGARFEVVVVDLRASDRVPIVERCGAAARPAEGAALAADTSAPRPVRTLAEMERDYIETALAANGGHRGKTARALGIDPKTLYNKLGPQRPRKRTS